MSRGMALIAVRAVIDIATYTLVLLVGLRLSVTDRAREHSVVRGIRVAVAARLGVAVVHREPCVVEFCVHPCRSVMTRLAGGWEPGGLVVRVGGVVVVLLVARITVCGKVLVVVVHVALAAGNLGVLAGQRPTRRTVIELAIGPENRVMTHFALLWKSCGLMVRVVGLVVVVQVARHASRVCQFVVVVHVTLRTLQCLMRASQRPSGFAVVEQCSGPG